MQSQHVLVSNLFTKQIDIYIYIYIERERERHEEHSQERI